MRHFAIIALLFSVQAKACPQLAGSYTCSYKDSSEVFILSQEVKGGVTVYSSNVFTPNGSKMLADDVAYPQSDDVDLREITLRARCADAFTVKANLVSKYAPGGQYIGDMNMIYAFTLKGTSLKMTVTGTLKTRDGKSPLSREVICPRNRDAES